MPQRTSPILCFIEIAVDRLEFVSLAAAEIDRLVVRGHARASEHPDKPRAVVELKAFPQLLSTAAIALLDGAVSRTAAARVVPYTPRSMVDALIDNNITEGVITEDGEDLALTAQGRDAAEGVVAVQEAAIATIWSTVPDQVKEVERFLGEVVAHGRSIAPPRTPSNFEVFAAVCDRPTREGRTLRLITAVRYWRSDAHAVALDEAGLQPFEAHALNRLWDAHRGLDRLGQGFPEPGRKGVASLEARGLAEAGTITNDGIDLRARIERTTDTITAPIYDTLDDAEQDDLLAALRQLPD